MHERAHPPRVTRVSQADEPWPRPDGCLEQGRQVWVATDDRVQRDDIGRRQLLRDLDHVAEVVLDPPIEAAPSGLLARSGEVLARRVDVDRSLGSGLDHARWMAPTPEGFNNPNHAAQRYSWIRPPSTSLRSTGIRVFPRTCGVLLPAGAAKLNPRCGLSAM